MPDETVTRLVRVTRVWDVQVDAVYGDSDADLLAKASPGSAGAAVETKNLLPEG